MLFYERLQTVRGRLALPTSRHARGANLTRSNRKGMPSHAKEIVIHREALTLPHLDVETCARPVGGRGSSSHFATAAALGRR